MAATPATCGDAIDVPSENVYPLTLPAYAAALGRDGETNLA